MQVIFLPKLWGTANSREEHAIQVEISEGPPDRDTVEGERNAGNGEVESDTNDISFPNVGLAHSVYGGRATTTCIQIKIKLKLD